MLWFMGSQRVRHDRVTELTDRIMSDVAPGEERLGQSDLQTGATSVSLLRDTVADDTLGL